ncbi:MAG: hypothetical protein WEG36_12175 [Gemmatimonadota bacterium]
MNDPLVLYSTNTWLAWAIAERFYGGTHYAWCGPVFDGRTAAPHLNIPPTCSPCEIYHSLAGEVARGDLHSDGIKRNKGGILRGATARRGEGKITADDEKDIAAIIGASQVRDFRPLLFVIPFAPVAVVIKKVPVPDRAHPLSLEYIIENLPRASFDVLELGV